MALTTFKLFTMLMVLKYANTAPADAIVKSEKSIIGDTQDLEKGDLVPAASNAYPDRYSNWGRSPSSYGGSYGGVTGYGTVDNRYNNYGGIGSYDNSYGYNTYDNGYSGYGNRYSGYGGYSGSAGDYSGYRGGYDSGSYGNSGYGGYGGYAGNGGLNSYYGYNNPYYQGSNHLGYGYYKRTGAGNIYSSGITPNSVTGYRGYSGK